MALVRTLRRPSLVHWHFFAPFAALPRPLALLWNLSRLFLVHWPFFARFAAI